VSSWPCWRAQDPVKPPRSQMRLQTHMPCLPPPRFPRQTIIFTDFVWISCRIINATVSKACRQTSETSRSDTNPWPFLWEIVKQIDKKRKRWGYFSVKCVDVKDVRTDFHSQPDTCRPVHFIWTLRLPRIFIARYCSGKSVCLSVRHTMVLYLNERTYHQTLFTVW